MRSISILLVSTILVSLTSLSTEAQNEIDSGLVVIETVDGNEFIGHIVSEDSQKIVLRTENLGEITIQRSNIRKTSFIEPGKIVRGKYWFENPQTTRYLWSPNGYGLKKGEGYYQNVWILFNQFAVGITDNVSVGAGLIPLFLFSGTSTPVWFTPRVSFPLVKDKFNVGGGALIGTVLGEEDSGFGILYGNTTFGSRDRNLNIGLGWGYTGDGGIANSPTITVSGMVRLGARGYFLTENYIINAGETLLMLSAGGRVIIKRVSLDFGLVSPFTSDQEVFFAIPWIGFVVPFGNTAAKNYR